MDLYHQLSRLKSEKNISMLIIGCAAAHGESRKHEYGVQWASDYKGRGESAKHYASFINHELMYWIKENYLIDENTKTGIAGWSLGGLMAFDIGWHAPDLFDLIGVFSGSFWWRNPNIVQDDEHHRLMHHRVMHTSDKPTLKVWFQAGTEDEKADRNQNGIIDVIDDTLDLMYQMKSKGYEEGKDMVFHIEEGGRHDVETWNRMMPLFFEWAVN